MNWIRMKKISRPVCKTNPRIVPGWGAEMVGRMLTTAYQPIRMSSSTSHHLWRRKRPKSSSERSIDLSRSLLIVLPAIANTLRVLSKPSQRECGYRASPLMPSSLGNILEREDLPGRIGPEVPGEDVALCRVVGNDLDGVGRGGIGELEAASNNVLVELQS